MERASYCSVLMTNEMHNSYNQFYSIVFCLHNILYYRVHYFVLLMMNDQIHSKNVEQTKNCGIKIDYKNCASRWSLTHCNTTSIATWDATCTLQSNERIATRVCSELRIYSINYPEYLYSVGLPKIKKLHLPVHFSNCLLHK